MIRKKWVVHHPSGPFSQTELRELRALWPVVRTRRTSIWLDSNGLPVDLASVRSGRRAAARGTVDERRHAGGGARRQRSGSVALAWRYNPVRLVGGRSVDDGSSPAYMPAAAS